MSDKNTVDKMIPDPENPEEMIENPDYVDPNEDDDDDDGEELSSEDKQKLEKLVEAELKKMKENMDRMAASRDEALDRVKEFEGKEREAEIARLKEEGKLQEAHEKEKADLEAEVRNLKKSLVAVTRDVEVRDALDGFEFRNDRARKSVVREITDELVQNDKGEWVHKNGASIADTVQAFFKDESNTFYLKPKMNRGSGADSQQSSDQGTKKPKSWLETDQNDLLKQIAKEQADARKNLNF